MTRVKIIFINAVIALGVAVIIWKLWPEAMQNHFVGAGYDQGNGMAVYLAVLMTGIPALLYAVGVHVALSHWLFAPDELRSYRARLLVERTKVKGSPKKPAPSTQSGKHDFID